MRKKKNGELEDEASVLQKVDLPFLLDSWRVRGGTRGTGLLYRGGRARGTMRERKVDEVNCRSPLSEGLSGTYRPFLQGGREVLREERCERAMAGVRGVEPRGREMTDRPQPPSIFVG